MSTVLIPSVLLDGTVQGVRLALTPFHCGLPVFPVSDRRFLFCRDRRMENGSPKPL